jgi:arylamine N-acetyltransferase
MATPEGRVTLAERRLICTRKGVREERLLASEEEWQAALQEHFGVVL